MPYLLDTDVCIEFLANNKRVRSKIIECQDIVGTSWISGSELFHGAFKSGKPRRNTGQVENCSVA